MAVQENVQINFVTSFSDKGIKNAQSQLSGFESLARKAALTFAGLFATQKILAFGKASVQAFTADDKAAKLLAQTISNLGIYLDPKVLSGYIQKLQDTTGVLDDQLRPAFSSLIVATKDFAKAQNLMSVALDVSAGTGKDLGAVSAALSKAYLGNYGALARLNVGVSKADVASKNFNAILNKISLTYKGEASAAAQTYAGKMKLVTAAVTDAKEAIGQGIITGAADALGMTADVTSLTAAIKSFGTELGNAIIGVGTLIGKLQSSSLFNNPVAKFLGNTTSIGKFGWINALANIGKKSEQNKAISTQLFGTDLMREQARLKTIAAEKAKQQAVAEKSIATSTAASAKATKDKLAAEKASLVLKQASKVLDVDQAQIVAALAGKISEDERTRLLLQQALLNDNADVAGSLAQKLIASQMEAIKLAALNPVNGWSSAFDEALQSLLALQAALAALSIQAVIPSNTGMGGVVSDYWLQGLAADVARRSSASETGIQVTLSADPSLAAIGITGAVTNASANGNQPVLTRSSGIAQWGW